MILLLNKKVVIFNSGKKLFCSKGFKDTSVSDITKLAGIGVGTFYNYYPSKEKLFLEIHIQENDKLKKNIMESVNFDEDPTKAIKEALSLNIKGMNSNPILKEWYNRDVFTKLEKYYRKENGKNDVDFLYNNFADLIKKWQTEKKIRDDLDFEFILALFNSIIFIDTHKREIGIHHFPKIIDYLAEFIMKGLTNFPK
nr:TetR/AcrR family transcriptional regulator [Clostridium drakei]